MGSQRVGHDGATELFNFLSSVLVVPSVHIFNILCQIYFSYNILESFRNDNYLKISISEYSLPVGRNVLEFFVLA